MLPASLNLSTCQVSEIIERSDERIFEFPNEPMLPPPVLLFLCLRLEVSMKGLPFLRAHVGRGQMEKAMQVTD